MKAEIITIGTELLLGEIVDTNSAYLTRQLRDIGVNIYYLTTVGDNTERIADAIRIALARSGVVITTGGLGPTVDDMTRQGVALATNRELEFRPDLFEQIRERFEQLGAQMSDNNRVQAFVPAGSIPITNRLGTAPCFIVETPQGAVISLPGVPREMKDILAQTVIPYLRERMGGKGIIKARVLRTAGIGESHIDTQIADLETWSNPTVGLAAHSGQTDIRITARADTEAEADALIAQAETIIRARLGSYIFGIDKTELDDALIALLRQRQLTLAVSYAGPQDELFVRRFHHEDVVIARVHEPSLSALAARLDEVSAPLDYGQLARREARRLLDDSGATVAIAFVTDDEGTGIAALTRDKERIRRYKFGGADAESPAWAGTWAMGMAWQLVREMDT
ncbi:MAG: CinA family nicotinamide mononucleotide deamidase-related protein [Anaerolineae bacterium]|mgnify:CR=1 FL=1|nr:CinA family nicotinamide mononucleotide deamidase-related protein [Anaerolineae bacterium]MEB2286927.1 CinA family nicotinamide mononucleotide deamidase-related protein [Anaerolineae bacterium]